MTINTFEIQYASCQCRSWFVCMCAEEGFMHLGRGHERRPHNFTVILFHMKDPRLELQTHESSLACVPRYTVHKWNILNEFTSCTSSCSMVLLPSKSMSLARTLTLWCAWLWFQKQSSLMLISNSRIECNSNRVVAYVMFQVFQLIQMYKLHSGYVRTHFFSHARLGDFCSRRVSHNFSEARFVDVFFILNADKSVRFDNHR